MSKRFDELFREIVSILREDWAGRSLAGDRFDPRYYNQAIGQAWHDGKLDELLFLRYVNQMLACTGDRHLRLALRPSETYTPFFPGFFARRYENALYVTEVCGNDRLRPGDRIAAINGGTPAEHRRQIQKNFFYADEPEREDFLGLLRMADHIDLERPDGSRERLALGRYPLTPDITPGPVLYLEPDYVILDLHNKSEVTEDEFTKLLPLLCRKPTPLRALADGDLYVNYTRRNCLIRAASLAGLDGAEDYITELREKAGKGWLYEPDEEDGVVEGRGPARRIVLIDTWTRDGAEALALAAKRAGAYLIGRPTLGTLDLCGDVSYALDERYTLTWPTAVTRAAREGNGVFGRGVQPDLYIPWTPAECRSDRLLDEAMRFLEANT